MHASGHVGVGFATAAPFVVCLDAVGLGDAALPATVFLVVLSTLPDVDEYVPGLTHRGGTHSLPFAVAVGVLTAGVAWVAGPALVGGERTTVAFLGFAVGTLAVILHLLADVVTPMGVYPLWPLSAERRSLDLVPSASPRANRAALVAGGLLWSSAVLATTVG